jgi:hypothetical protein
MPGRVVTLLVGEGEEVEAGQGVGHEDGERAQEPQGGPGGRDNGQRGPGH